MLNDGEVRSAAVLKGKADEAITIAIIFGCHVIDVQPRRFARGELRRIGEPRAAEYNHHAG
jgi:hypothetical protein